MSTMIKTIICKYFLKGKCKFMNNPDKCQFAHGEKELVKIECKYKQYCINSRCTYNHDAINSEYSKPDKYVYEPIINKNYKNKKLYNYSSKKYYLKNNKFKIIVNRIILHIKIKKFLENKKINLIKSLEYKIKKQNEFIHNNNIKEMYNILKRFNINKNLEKLEKILKCYFKSDTPNLQNTNNINNNIEIRNNNKTLLSFQKYYNVGCMILKDINNWKNIIKNIIYFKNEKNIYKVKNRALRIVKLIDIKYKSINNLQNIINNNKLSIRNIFNMNNNLFNIYINS